MITSILDKKAGFYSILFFTINHYIYCKKNNISFRLDSSNWLFKSVEGWTDYFQNIDFDGESTVEDRILGHNQLAGDFNMHEYQNTIHKEFYLYNEKVQKEIDDKKKELGLFAGEYDAVFIRRGDKLCCESKFFETGKYVDLLLQKHPECKTIFLQTDDYNCFLDLQKYVEERNLEIRVVTICDPNTKGMVVFERELSVDLHNCKIGGNVANIEYLEKVADHLQNATPVEKMNADEIYRHTIDMLIGIDIALWSDHCVLDWQSNVARFISVAHIESTKLYDIRFPTEHLNMGWTMCPAYW